MENENKNRFYLSEALYIELDKIDDELAKKMIKSLETINSKEFRQEREKEEKQFKKNLDNYFMNIAENIVNGKGDLDFFFNEIFRCSFCIKTMVGNDETKNKCMYCHYENKPCTMELFKLLGENSIDDETFEKKIKDMCIKNISDGLKLIRDSRFNDLDYKSILSYRSGVKYE